MANVSIKTIILYPRPHVDTIVATFLLQKYGKDQYEGITSAEFEFLTSLPEGTTDDSLLAEGKIAIDIGGGMLDHHGSKKTVSQLVAEHLDVASNKELRKLLEWVQRDEQEGKGTLSDNVLDKAFGLSGLIMALHRTYLNEPEHVIRSVHPLIEAHVAQERRRYVEIPAEWEESLANGKATVHNAKQNGKKVKVVALETSSMDIAGYLRNSRKVAADVVIQILPQGNTNVITNQKKNIDLTQVVTALRTAEAQKKQIDLAGADVTAEGRIDGIPEWYYDTAANTVQNGGVVPESMHPTAIPATEAIELIVAALNGEASMEKTVAAEKAAPAPAPPKKEETVQQETQPAHAPEGLQVFEVPHYDETAMRMAVLVSTDPKAAEAVTQASELFANPDVQAGVVLQSGNGTHALRANPDVKVELRDVVRVIRMEEARKRGINLDGESSRALSKPGELDEMPGWTFEHQDNVLLWNGNDDSQLSPEEMMQAVYAGLSNELLETDCPPAGCRGPECYFFMYQLPRCKERKKESSWKADGTIRGAENQ